MLSLRICLISCIVVTATAISPSEEKSLIETLMQNYDGNIRPKGLNRTASGSYPTTVTVNTFLRSISNVDDVNMVMSPQIILRMQWVDERLKFNRGDVRYLTFTPTFGAKLWKPDLFFSNEIEYRKHDGLMPNEYYRIFPNGEILYSSRISLKLSCPMIMKLYPFDSQTCSLRMASYGYTTDDIIFKWKPQDPVQVTRDLHLPKFSLRQYTTDYCDSQTNTGVYSCLRADLLFKRELSSWVFAPMTFAILIIWCSMFISPMDNGIVRALVLGAGAFYCKWSSHSTHNSLPVVSYTTAFDTWCCFMNIFILVAIIEFVIVIRLSKNGKQDNFNNSAQTSGRWTRLCNGIDIGMRIIYPLALLGCVLLYYIAYSIKGDEDPDAE